jgi:crotonobetainyl-CoA:carnitine CoA-transferase CaiB-like acyl-CoA transferase
MQAEAGHMSLTGDPQGTPERYGLSVVDLMTGLVACFALLAGISSARESGHGRDLDTSLFDLALFNLNYPGSWYLNAGAVQGREKRSAHPSIVPSQLYRTRDGWIFVMCNKEKFWVVLADELGHPEWASDPRFATFAQRLERRDEITVLLDEAFSRDTTAAWLSQLSGKIPVAPVNDIAQALENPFVAERGGVADFCYEDGRKARLLANPIRCSDVDLPRRAAPALGADSPERIIELRALRAIG